MSTSVVSRFHVPTYWHHVMQKKMPRRNAIDTLKQNFDEIITPINEKAKRRGAIYQRNLFAESLCPIHETHSSRREIKDHIRRGGMR
mmetsp:Transcript_15825/g.19304  ORF Transcript_15825/g.19304 Transcript_15825/m.19304 type:complete len:87 (+) Transcript_15825:72-332(+)